MSMMHYSKCPECKEVFWFDTVKLGRGGKHKRMCKQPTLVKFNPDSTAPQPIINMDLDIVEKIVEAMKDPHVFKKIKELAKF